MSDHDRHRQSSRNGIAEHLRLSYDVVRRFIGGLKTGIDATETSFRQQLAARDQSVAALKEELAAYCKAAQEQEGRIQELEKKNEGLESKIKLMADQLSVYANAEAQIKELSAAAEKLRTDNAKVKTQAVHACCQCGGDVATFAQLLMGVALYEYPEDDHITLNRSQQELRYYDLMGATPFTQETPECRFKVLSKGWREANKIWIEARIIPVSTTTGTTL